MTVLSETPINKEKFEYIMDYKLKYKKLTDLPINKWKELQEILTDESTDEITKNVQLTALFFDITEDEVWGWHVFDQSLALGDIITVLEHNDYQPQGKLPKTIKIADNVYSVVDDVSKFTVAQYVDFQHFIKSGDEAIAELLSTFIIPKGKKYNEDYEIDEVIKTFNERLPIGTAFSLRFFFVKKLIDSINSTVQSLVKKMMRRAMWKAMKEQRKEAIQELKTMMHIRG